MLWKQSVLPFLERPPPFAHGAIAGKRREEAIAVQNIMAFRLRASGVSSVLRLYDVKNAFPSPSHECLRDFFESLPPSQDVNILLQHILGHRCELSASDGAILLQPGAGIPQGSPIATDVFNQIYWKAVNMHEAEMADCNALLVGGLPHDTRSISVATTVFVDDMASRLADTRHQPLLKKVQLSSTVIIGRSPQQP